MNKIIIYTNKNCKYCITLKEELTKKEIDFTENLTSEFTSEWQSVVSLTGIPTVPTMYYKGTYFVSGRDFGAPEHLINIIENFKTSEHSVESQTLERVKTLSFNMGTAFRNMEKAMGKLENKLNTKEENEH
tara:strand:+ start:673 stop:1065 length:393 start_codon:yes stop_codon:yes gene_type:complete